MTGICDLLSAGRAGSLITRWLTNLAGIREAGGGVKKTSEKCQKTSPTASKFSTVINEISIYNLVVLVFVCITYSS